MKYFKKNRRARALLTGLSLICGQIPILAVLSSCSLFASAEGFEAYRGQMPDKSFVKGSESFPKQKLKEDFRGSYPRPV